MKRLLSALVISAFTFIQSSCATTHEYRCPSDEDILRAGLYMFSGLNHVRPESNESISIARLQYEFARVHYFEGDDPYHCNQHTDQAIATAFEYYNLPSEKRIELLSRLRLVDGTKERHINDFPWTSSKK